jgi:uncharacterized membrane protein
LYELLAATLQVLVPFIEALGAIVVVVGCLRAIYQYFARFIGQHRRTMTQLRLSLGQSLVLGLEFQVASDVLTTALNPTWEELGLLAATITLRTVLDYFLEHELSVLNHGSEEAPARQE